MSPPTRTRYDRTEVVNKIDRVDIGYRHSGSNGFVAILAAEAFQPLQGGHGDVETAVMRFPHLLRPAERKQRPISAAKRA